MKVFDYKDISLCFLFMFWTHLHFGQDDGYLQGRVIDEQTTMGIPFVTVRIIGTNKGLITNADGGFQIPASLNTSNDTLLFTSIGYIEKKIALSAISIDTVATVALSPGVEALNEVVIHGRKRPKRKYLSTKSALSASNIVSLAIAQIPVNYPMTPFSYVGYYRDYQVENGDYINLNEAILKVYDQGFDANDLATTRVMLHQLKINNDFKRNDAALRQYDFQGKTKTMENAIIGTPGVNEFMLLRLHDAIRNYRIDTYDYINLLYRDLISNHILSKLDETTKGSIQLYTIGLTRNSNGIKVSGKLYIEKGTYAIHKLEYTVAKIPALNIGKQKASLKSNASNLEQILYSIVEEYQLIGNYMYPSYISFNNAFEIQSPPLFQMERLELNREQRYFEIYFNQPLSKKRIERKRNYKLMVNQKPFKLDRIVAKDSSVILYPKDAEALFSKNAIALKRLQETSAIAVQVENIEDLEGNQINQTLTKEYSQFREFFVQEITDDIVIYNLEFMNKTEPIFKKQPMQVLDNIDEYWMNTPLINTKSNVD